MASPADSTSGDNAFGKPKAGLEQITFRFCSECSNMLYPKEDEDAHKLQFTCRTCQYTEEATSMCIFRNVLNNAAGETAGVTQDVGQDPTVGSPSHTSAAGVENNDAHEDLGDAPFCDFCGDIIRPAYYLSAAAAEHESEPAIIDVTMSELAELEEEEVEEGEEEGDDVYEWEDVPIRNSKKWEDKFQEGLVERLRVSDNNRATPLAIR